MSVTATVALVQGILGLMVLVIAAVVGRSAAQKVAREKYVQAIDELTKLADSHLAVIAEKDRRMHDLESRQFDLNRRVSQLEGYNKRLIEEQLTDRDYQNLLVSILREHKIAIPPREQP